MSKIIVYEGKRRRGSTSDAFNDIVTEELMREYTLSFSIANTDSIFPLISEKASFSRGGQMFDLTGINTNTITSNITQITAEHVSYRLNDYAILAGYAYVGTLREITQDILSVAENIKTGGHASDIFTIGNVPDISDTFSFRMQNTAEATARDALISLQKLGVEIEFDNYTVNIVARRGTDRGLILSYTANLEETQRVYERGNGWTYDVKAALLPDEYSLGDDITINDALIGTSRNERIITTVDCADDPTQNRIVTGVFVLDSATQSAETERIAENSVQQGEKYNNVYINHGEGFVAENKAGTQRVIMNAEDCFSVQVLKNGEWVTVTSTEEWGVLTPRLTTRSAKNSFYATVGSNESGNLGFFLYTVRNGAWIRFCDIWLSSNGNTVVESKQGDLVLMAANGKDVCFERKSSGAYGNTGTVQIGNVQMSFENGIFTGEKYSAVWSGTVPLSSNETLRFVNGILTEVFE